MAELTVGQIIASDYRLEKELGRGGFGVVWKAHHMRLNREVAVKMIHGEALSRVPDIGARFTREVELAKQLEHPNVVRMYDYGELPDGSLFMVMEFILGRELKDILVENGGLGTQRAMKIITQILDALSEAHNLGIVHRDMKPANIMITSKGLQKDRVKLLDFGIAKALDSLNTDQDLTGTGTSFGTPQYMAPEQIMGRDIGPFTDLYAVGLILLELLTGQRAVVGNTAHEIAMKQVMEEISIPANIVRTGLGPILRRALSKDANLRYQTAAEMYQDIEHIDSPHVQAHTPMSGVSNPHTGPMPQLVGEPSPSTGGQRVGATRVLGSGDQEAVSGPYSQSGPVPSQSGPVPSQSGPVPSQSGPWSQSGQQSGPFAQSGPWQQQGHSGPMYPSHSGMAPVPGHPGYQQAPQGGSKLPIVIAIVLVLVVLGGGAAFFVLSSGSDKSAEAADKSKSAEKETVSTPDPAGDPAAGAAADPVSRIPAIDPGADADTATETAKLEEETAPVKLRIESDVEAEVFRDGKSLGTTPLELSEPRSDGDVEFVLKASGHEDEVLIASFTSDLVVSADLTPAGKTKSKRRSKKKAKEKTAAEAKPPVEEEKAAEEEEPEKRSFRRTSRKKKKDSGSGVDVPTL